MKKKDKVRGKKSRKLIKIEEEIGDIYCYSCFGLI
jgi:hypothetical protein